MRCLLVSTSPRRKELFRYICDEFDVVSPHYEEEPYNGGDINEFVLRQAKGKLDSVTWENYDVVVASDTVVYIPSSDMLLGKPKDEKDAVFMLKMLMGRTHSVITGVAIKVDGKLHLIHETTQVKFRIVPDKFIEEYVSTGLPLDKAGAYGIQDSYGAILVESIIGDYYNVVGFPVGRVWEILSPYIAS
ncbi:MAG: septum formation protein Maf [Dictyoglomi bacterium]|nr:septum formation protein Maf [Dictyoglomota bacterium]